MLPPSQQIAFLVFAAVALLLAALAWRGLFRRIAAGRPDTEARFDHLPRRLWYALATTLTQRRTFRKRPWVSFFHALIFYGFVLYLLVNVVDAAEGFIPFTIRSDHPAGAAYNLLADLLSAAVLLGVAALVLRRFLLPSRRDFRFNARTLLHPSVRQGYVRFDSIIVSAFIFIHVGSRALGQGAKLAAEGPDHFQPFATLLSHGINPTHAADWRVLGYWGALGSALAFLAYFPRSKHIHIFMAPAKYALRRGASSGVLPPLDLNMEADEPALGANRLQDLAWPRLLDAYACIQCNRCQDACPASATGKALSPSALEINKRMELNRPGQSIESRPLLAFALSPEAAWACTTCGACIEVCPVQDDPMLDIVDVRRHQVMVAGEFPAQLQNAFRGMERARNPWGINHEKRMDWAEGLDVKTTDENPEPDVLFWVGCAAAYDPQSQKTARAFVQLLRHAGVDFAVLGKRECCTGDSARRAGNEYLYRQLAERNVATLNTVRPRLIVATCPHCMNAVGKEYGQLGGDYKVVHHTEYLQSLVADGRLPVEASSSFAVAFHDPCYLGRHSGVYDAPRNLLHVLSNSVVELERSRENSFCCGAGGAQFWKEEEPGSQRISDNRYAEAERTLGASGGDKVLAVGCPFCKSMLASTPGNQAGAVAVKDIAELLLENVQGKAGLARPVATEARIEPAAAPAVSAAPPAEPTAAVTPPPSAGPAAPVPTERKKWVSKKLPASQEAAPEAVADAAAPKGSERKKWAPKKHPEAQASATDVTEPAALPAAATPVAAPAASSAEPAKRKVWTPKRPPL